MSFITIPTETSTVHWSQTTTLDGVDYLLTFRYNQRESCYYLQIQSNDGTTTYAQGIKLVSNFFLLRPYATPPGEMMCISLSTTDDSPPEFGELGSGLRCELIYVPEQDLVDWGFEPERFPGFIV